MHGNKLYTMSERERSREEIIIRIKEERLSVVADEQPVLCSISKLLRPLHLYHALTGYVHYQNRNSTLKSHKSRIKHGW